MDSPVPPQSPTIGGGPVLLDRPSAVRTERAVRWVETTYRNRQPPGGRGLNVGTTWLRKAKTGSGGIPAATANDTPGSATITFCEWSDSLSKWVPTSETNTGLNPSAAAPVTANWIITVGWVSGMWEVQMDPC